MQTLTRNPLADPGILGVNSGASFAIVLGAALFGIPSAGAAADGVLRRVGASLLVAFTGSQGGGQLSPVRLTSPGSPWRRCWKGFQRHRPAQPGRLRPAALLAGRLAGYPHPADAENRPAAGGDCRRRDAAAEPGVEQPEPRQRYRHRARQPGARTQLIGLLAITVLCGSATAVVGPIAFIGLMMPHMARWLVGADHRWSLPVTLLATPALLLFADVLGRLLVPGELRVSVVSAFIGAPVLIWLVRRQPRGGGM
jgi:iron complex transport system permease protein